MLGFLTKGLEKIYATLSTPLKSLLAKKPDAQTVTAIETLLLEADTGVATTQLIIDKLKVAWSQGNMREGSDIQDLLKQELITLLGVPYKNETSQVYVLVGINGSGKTTTAGKLAYRYTQQGKRVLLVAADTFRAAAVQQLEQWAQKTNSAILTGKPGQEPGSIIFQGCQAYKEDQYDILIIDTAGRLQTKNNLMKELEKISRIIERQLPTTHISTLLTIDAMLGQNSREQARLFDESTKLNGIILTKIDGTGKGGIIFSIRQDLDVPIAYLSFGEQLDQLLPFDPETFVTTMLQQQ